MSAPRADDMPPWRVTLLSVPPEQRSESQRNLVRGLELADVVKEELKTPITPALDDPRVLKVLWAAVETFVLGPFQYSATLLLDEATKQRLTILVLDLVQLSTDLLGKTTMSKFRPHLFPALLSLALFSLFCISSELARDRYIPNTSMKIFVDLMVDLDWAAVEQTLAGAGSTMKLEDPTNFMIVSYSIFLLNCTIDSSEMPKQLYQSFQGSLTAPLPPWRLVAVTKFYLNFIEKFEGDRLPDKIFGARRDSAWLKEMGELLKSTWRLCRSTLVEAVAAAEAAGDKALVALAANQLFFIKQHGMGYENVSEMMAAAAKAEAAVAGVRHWLPRTHRDFLKIPDIASTFSHHQDAGTITSTAYLNLLSVNPRGHYQRLSCRRPPPRPLRTCGACGAQSTELMSCAGCRCRWFCNTQCQRLAWKAGHKSECAALKAAAEEARAAEEAAAAQNSQAAVAAASAGARAGPSNSSKRVNNKKKKKNKGSKK